MPEDKVRVDCEVIEDLRGAYKAYEHAMYDEDADEDDVGIALDTLRQVIDRLPVLPEVDTSGEEDVSLSKFDVSFLGECMGIGVTDSSPRKCHHACIHFLIEDDGYWYEKASFSVHWLDELIAKLTMARDLLRSK